MTKHDPNRGPRRPTVPRAPLYMIAFMVGVVIATVILWAFGRAFPAFPFQITEGALFGIVGGMFLGGALIYSFYRRTGQG